MRIGFDVSQTCEPKTGCAWFADSLIKEIIQIGTNDEFILYHHFGSLINKSTTKGTRIVKENVHSPFINLSYTEAQRIWSDENKLYNNLGEPDIVHANSFRCPKINGTKLVFTVYDMSFWDVPEFTTETNRTICQEGILDSLNNADAFIFISDSTRNEFESLLPGWLKENNKPWIKIPVSPRRNIFYNKLENFHNKPDKLKHNKFWLAVGSIEPRKNYDNLLDALELYWEKSKNKIPLVIAGGTGWKSTYTLKRIYELEAKGLIVYLGYVDDELLSYLYKNALALIFPSFYEGYGLPVIEALVNGCPVILSNHSTLQHFKTVGVNFIDHTNYQSIACELLKTENKLFSYIFKLLIRYINTLKVHKEKQGEIIYNFYKSLL